MRPDYQRLLSDAYNKAFDVIVSEGLDRLSRDPEATAALYKRMSFHNIRIVTRTEGEITDLHVGMNGIHKLTAHPFLALDTLR